MHARQNDSSARQWKSTHNQSPRVINVDKNAAYPPALDELKADQTLSETTELRPVKYLNNIVEQDHRFIKRLVNPGMGNVAHSIQRGELWGATKQWTWYVLDKLLGVEKGDVRAQVGVVLRKLSPGANSAISITIWAFWLFRYRTLGTRWSDRQLPYRKFR